LTLLVRLTIDLNPFRQPLPGYLIKVVWMEMRDEHHFNVCQDIFGWEGQVNYGVPRFADQRLL
jgi:hypothetical protein